MHDQKKANALHQTTWLCTRLLGFAPDYWALHPTTGICTRRLGFAPDHCAFHPKTRLCTLQLGFHPNTLFLTQAPKSKHGSDQCTLIGYFPLNPRPL